MGIEKVGSPWGRSPKTATPALFSNPNRATASVEPPTATRTPGIRLKRLSRRITTSVLPPNSNVTQFTFPASTPETKPAARSNNPSALTEKPNSFGNWLTITVNAMPFR